MYVLFITYHKCIVKLCAKKELNYMLCKGCSEIARFYSDEANRIGR